MAFVIGFFLKSQFKILNTVKDTVADLKIVVEVLKTTQENKGTSCLATHAIVDKRLNNHADRLDEHSGRLPVVETKMDIQNE